mmetsp:Transcript_8622/g.10007  ORF Transcript_8622/g.10007 Transcript_8622/m.10007 type:complete len:130 (-) Transcript_8622:162-551(-)|eukprot:CAMPEP_0204642840 /NCGR_PEP_ID=MMETSP0718-20130828/185_1 /ASSEMBLY_ACC=CAM_ASM_000674 /TAXON_ID=230516 /ORGANISM="Chaetoceros curvisetus" /LENGTH=129 /DNA_ID=CAMNT_0051663727 /DNA_START=204 /DNA_END=593 /DNA_ORIENTATION=-
MNGSDLPVVGAAIGCCSSPVEDVFPKDEEKQFVNKGLQRWEEGRVQWLTQDNSASQNVNGGGKKSSGNNKRGRGAVDLNVDEIIDCIVSNRWRSALKGGKDKAMFPQAVPLPQMIDILTDLWEAEGLDV